MEMKRSCACKGIRSCFLCKPDPLHSGTLAAMVTFIQCHRCGNLIRSSEDHSCPVACRGNSGRVLRPCLAPGQLPEGLVFDGVTIIKDFINEEEENSLIREINVCGWAESQSGRRKQVKICTYLLQMLLLP